MNHCSGSVQGRRQLTVAPVTSTVAESVRPSLVAKMRASPGATAVATPLGATVATAVSLVSQVIVRPVRTRLPASYVVAVNGVVWPTESDVDDGETSTRATGAWVT